MRKTSSNRISRLTRWGLLAATAFSLAAVSQATAAGIPTLETKDKLKGYSGQLRNGSMFTADAAGHTGKAGDTAIDFGRGTGPVVIQDASFLNDTAKNDEMTFSIWVKKYDIADSSVFWANAAASGRGWQAHTPWSNNNIYFDTVGCCDGGTQRINGDVANLPDYQTFGGTTACWTNWHHFVFTKKAEVKRVWIDGVIFLEGANTAVLPQDFTSLYLGSDGTGASLMHGLIDDFSVYGTALEEADVQKLFTGTLPTALASTTKLTAYWDFNDVPAEGAFTSILPADKATAAAPNLIQIVHLDGTIAWDASKVSLKVDGTDVAVTFVKDGKKATVSYVPTPLFETQSKHTAAFTYPTATGTSSFDWTFTVGGYTKDKVASRIGILAGTASFTPGGGGFSGKPGDYGMDLKSNAGGYVSVPSGAFLNDATKNDEMSFSFWMKKYGIPSDSVFWAYSPSSNNGERGWQAHVPWGDSTIYFDTAGCCDAATQRMNANINTFADYTGDAGWWTNWHHFVFSKKADVKQIWIDGKIFYEASNTGLLPTDFYRLQIGADASIVDDFAIWSKQLVEADINKLFTGTVPTTLPAANGLMAYWDFNDIPVDGLFTSFTPADGNTTAPRNLVQVQHSDGSTPWDLTKVSLSIDGKLASTATVTRNVNLVTVKYVPSPDFAMMSTHTASLTYPIAAGGTKTIQWSFTVGMYTKDKMHNYVGALNGVAKFTADGGGKSGVPGDYAIDFTSAGAGQSVYIDDANFLNIAGTNDSFTIVAWQKLYNVVSSALFWGVSPISNGSTRGIGTHAPWSGGTLYFDTAGCCTAGSQRLNAAISTFPDYSGNDTWWTNWHHIAFVKNLGTKEIWIDGVLFVQGDGTANPLPTDFTVAYWGYDPPDNASMHGLLDEAAVYATALDESNIQKLFKGTSPKDLASSTQILAYWDFNDAYKPVTAVTLSYAKSGTTLTITYTGKLQASDSVNGTWTDVAGAASPFAVTIPAAGNKFYRAASQ